MYISPLALFIIAEIVVVYFILMAFFLYKSRLYHVLCSILATRQEKQREQDQRDVEKEKNLAALRAKIDYLKGKTEPEVEVAGNSTGAAIKQLTHHIERAKRHHIHHPLPADTQTQKETLLTLRFNLLDIELDLLMGKIDEHQWLERATQLINQLMESEPGSNNDNRANNGSTTSEQHVHNEDVNQLKMENIKRYIVINDTKVQLEQFDKKDDDDQYTALLKQLNADMEDYLKTSDILLGLVEKELTDAKHTIEQTTTERAQPEP